MHVAGVPVRNQQTLATDLFTDYSRAGVCSGLAARSCPAAGYRAGPLSIRSAPMAAPLRVLRALAAPLPMLTASPECVPSLCAAARRPRIWVSLAPVSARDSANFSWCSAEPWPAADVLCFADVQCMLDIVLVPVMG